MTLKSEKSNEDYTEEQQKIGYVLQGIAQKTMQCLKKIVLITAYELKIGSDEGKKNKQKAIYSYIEESCIFQQNSKFQA